MKKEQVKECHLFSCDKGYYLLNIDDMTSYHLDKDEYTMLAQIKDKPLCNEEHKDIYVYLSLLNLIDGEHHGKKLPAMSPVSHIMMNITQECNLNCRYCYGVGGEYGSRGHMSRETALASVDWLTKESQDMRNLEIIFFGGEPLLNFALVKEVIDYAQSKKADKTIAFRIITNGTILNDDIMETFRKHHFRVGVSFDAVERLQNYYRPFKAGGDTYKIVRKHIADLIAQGVENMTITAMLPDDRTSFREARQALIATGCRTMGIHRPSPPLLKSDEAEHIEMFTAIKSGNTAEYTEKLLFSVEEEGRDWLTSIKERALFHSKLFSGITGQLYTRKKREYFC